MKPAMHLKRHLLVLLLALLLQPRSVLAKSYWQAAQFKNSISLPREFENPWLERLSLLSAREIEGVSLVRGREIKRTIFHKRAGNGMFEWQKEGTPVTAELEYEISEWHLGNTSDSKKHATAFAWEGRGGVTIPLRLPKIPRS